MSRTTSQRPVRCGRYAFATFIAFACVGCAGSDDSAEIHVTEPTAFVDVAETLTTEVDDPVETTPPVTTEPPGETQPVETLQTTTTNTDVERIVPDGFTTTMARITKADGTVCDVCLWLADEPDERGRGLMGVTDLGDAQGMIFLFEQPTTGSFFMFETVTALSIAWFSVDGAHVASADMEPCLEANSALCERFAPITPYQSAIEVFQGDLATIGVAEGSSVEILVGTEAPECPLADR